MRPFALMPSGFYPPAMNGGGASYRIRVWMPRSMQEGFQELPGTRDQCSRVSGLYMQLLYAAGV